jgi:RNA-directed DNA polymerase
LVKPLLPIWGEKKKRGKLNLTEKRLILKSQNSKCNKCHKRITLTTAHFDHKRPIGEGGSDTLRNIQALCALCHDAKTRKDVGRINKARAKVKKSLPRLPTSKDYKKAFGW